MDGSIFVSVNLIKDGNSKKLGMIMSFSFSLKQIVFITGSNIVKIGMVMVDRKSVV